MYLELLFCTGNIRAEVCKQVYGTNLACCLFVNKVLLDTAMSMYLPLSRAAFAQES